MNETEGGFQPRRQQGGYQQRGGQGGYRQRFNNGGGFNRPQQRRGGYDQHAKYSQKKRLEYKEENYDPTVPMRLNTFLANAGVCSRRDADKYIEAGVVSYKIEGRMKRPEYVAVVVDAYRRAIDSYKAGNYHVPAEDLANIEQIFNRD